MKIVLIALAFVVTSLLRPAANADSNSPVRIGAILPLSGDAASFGIAAQNGFRLGLETMRPEDRKQIELLIEDDQFSPAKSITAFRKLVDIDHAKAIVCFGSGPCNAIAPVAEAAKIPTMAIASDERISRGRAFVVNLWITPEVEAGMVIHEAIRRGYHNIAIVSAIWDGAFACRDAFLKQKPDSLNVVFNKEVDSGLQDFKTLALSLRVTKPDAVLTILMPGQQGVFAKQLRAAGVISPLFGFENFESEPDLRASAGALTGSWFVTAALGNSEFVASYKKRFPGASMVSSSNTHDALLLLTSAFGSDETPDHIATYLRTISNFKGASGTFSAIGDNRFSLPGMLKEVTDKGFEVITGGDA